MPRPRLIEVLRARWPERDPRELEAAVMRGLVRVDGQRIEKAGFPVREDAKIELPDPPPWVSRGGEKLAAALACWRPPVAGRVFIDAGSSTGGFTDCLLAHGARLVHCVDVGVGQLAWRLRTDARVRVREGTNALSLRHGDLDPKPDAVVADLSFRSLRGAARRLLDLTSEGWGIFLLKPQFEWRSPRAEFRGIVRRAEDLRQILEATVEQLWGEGARVRRLMASPLLGRRGNREFLLLLSNRLGGNRAAVRRAVARSLGE